jgi:hypothetical protein
LPDGTVVDASGNVVSGPVSGPPMVLPDGSVVSAAGQLIQNAPAGPPDVLPGGIIVSPSGSVTTTSPITQSSSSNPLSVLTNLFAPKPAGAMVAAAPASGLNSQSGFILLGLVVFALGAMALGKSK